MTPDMWTALAVVAAVWIMVIAIAERNDRKRGLHNHSRSSTHNSPSE